VKTDNGVYTTLTDPLATSGTYAFHINNKDQIVGFYSDGSGDHGFVYSNGAYTTLNDPLGVSTMAFGINDRGQIVGEYVDASNNYHGFLYSNGAYTTLNYWPPIHPYSEEIAPATPALALAEAKH
jgi:probable HAF family extracellular repeat protein